MRILLYDFSTDGHLADSNTYMHIWHDPSSCQPICRHQPKQEVHISLFGDLSFRNP